MMLTNLKLVAVTAITNNDGFNNMIALGCVCIWIVEGKVSMARNTCTNQFIANKDAQALLDQVMYRANTLDNEEYPILLNEVAVDELSLDKVA